MPFIDTFPHHRNLSPHKSPSFLATESGLYILHTRLTPESETRNLGPVLILEGTVVRIRIVDTHAIVEGFSEGKWVVIPWPKMKESPRPKPEKSESNLVKRKVD